MSRLNGIILNGQVFIIESAEIPCSDCSLKHECRHGVLVGRICSVIDDGERFRFSQELTDKLNRQTPKAYEEDEGCVRRK